MSTVLATSKALPLGDAQFVADVRTGLSRNGQKRLPPKYFYDALGSILFEAITQLPEYGLWRAEHGLLREHAAEIATLAGAANVIELGSGSATKTAVLLRALLRHRRVAYCAIDVSATALELTHQALGGLAGLNLRSIESEYLAGLEAALHSRAGGVTLVLLLGSSLGNLDSMASMRFLRGVRALLQPGDALLLGADLLKDEARMLAAYDDVLGVTAAFNLNLLGRMNRELGADFALERFNHRVRFNHETYNVEMHLESCGENVVHFRDGFSVLLHDCETIHTENSHKYTLGELESLIAQSGLRSAAQWIDEDWKYASCLLFAI